MKPKLLIVGWDAADYAIVNNLLSQGKLPALARLLEDGIKAPIASLNPMLSPILWTSIATGTRAYQHGVTGFTEVSEKGEVRAVRGSSRKIPAYWDILDHFGFKCHTIGWWPSHPTYASKGIQVSNFYGMAESPLDDWKLWPESVHPNTFFDELAGYRVHPSEITAEIVKPFFPTAINLSSDDEVLSSTVKITAHAASIHAAATRIMEEDWDVCSVYYDALDHYSHIGMRYFPPQLEGVSSVDFENYSGIVEAAYRYHDMMLDRLMTLAGENCNIIVLSDHGFKHGMDHPLHLPDLPGAPALEHHPYGLFVASGPAFKKEDVFGVSLLDIAPTILSIFNIKLNTAFEGRPLVEILRKYTLPVETINYQEVITKAWMKGETDSLPEHLRQLQELGYINLPNDHSSAVLHTEIENAYNLARSMVDGGKWRSALELMDQCLERVPTDGRIKHFRAGLLLQLGETEQLESEIASWTGEMSSHAAYFKGLVLAKKGNYRAAIEKLKVVGDQLNNQAEWSVVVSRVLREMGAVSDALEIVLQSIHIHANHENLLFEAALNYQRLGQHEEALEMALDATNLRPRDWKLHLLVGECLYELKEYQSAKQAFDTAYKLNNSHHSITSGLIKTSEILALPIAEQWKERPCITVVSGLPRSGTSMMMQILQAGGMDLYTDNIRQPDVNNPKGYFESAEVKDLLIDQSFLHLAENKVIKVVVPLLQKLPMNYSYRVIYMDRNIPEIILSQEVMKGRSREAVLKHFPYSLAVEYERLRTEAFDWLDRNQIPYTVVHFNEIADDPHRVIQTVSSFLHLSERNETMVEAIDTKLFRSRLS